MLTKHARQRMAQRKVTESDVRSALSNVRMTMPGDAGSTQFVGSNPSGRVLKVWVCPPADVGPEATVVVKSVAWPDEEDAR